MAERKFLKGDLVRFKLGTRSVQGEITEDRGPIGIRGRHLFLVEYRSESESTTRSQIELPADQLQPMRDVVSHE